MRTLLAVLTASAIVAIPVGAMAQQGGQQTTETQQNLKDNVKAKPRTEKRQEIIRSETNKNDTTGAAPAPAPR